MFSVRLTFFCSAGRVPSHAGQTDTQTCDARGAEAPRQRTARGRLLQGVVPRPLQRQSLAPVFWQRNATRCFYIWPLTQIVTDNRTWPRAFCSNAHGPLSRPVMRQQDRPEALCVRIRTGWVSPLEFRAEQSTEIVGPTDRVPDHARIATQMFLRVRKSDGFRPFCAPFDGVSWAQLQRG